MFYVIYKTTNLINGKWYIGYHKTFNLNDDYLGSGKLLKVAILKYGKDNFKKEILYVFPTKKEALDKEKELVNKSVVLDKNSYNYKIGGKGGWDHISKLLENEEYKSKKYSKVSNTLKDSYSSGKLKGWIINQNSEYGFKNKKHSEYSKKLISSNNGNLLDAETLNKRLFDLMNEEKTFGYISRLAKKWNISHTSVKRFIKKYEN